MRWQGSRRNKHQCHCFLKTHQRAYIGQETWSSSAGKHWPRLQASSPDGFFFYQKKKLVSTEEERASGYLHACRKKVLVAVSEEITETQKYITAAVSTVLVFLFALACRNTRNYRGSPPLLRWKGLNLFSSQDIHTSPDHSIFSPTLLSLKSLYW